MYARYTELEFDADDREQVLALWRDMAVPSASAPARLARLHILESQDTPGVLRLVTLWDAPEDFERYYTGPEHVGLSRRDQGRRGCAARSATGLTAHHAATPARAAVRVTRADRAPGADRRRDRWRDSGERPLDDRRAVGQPRAQRRTGASRAQFELVVEWRDRAAQAFLDGTEPTEFGHHGRLRRPRSTERIVGERSACRPRTTIPPDSQGAPVMTIGLGILGATGKTRIRLRGPARPALLRAPPVPRGAGAHRGRSRGRRQDLRGGRREPLAARRAGPGQVGGHGHGRHRQGGARGRRASRLVLSALPGPHAKQLDPQVAELGFPVVSESAGLRLEPDIPLIVPDINADHLPLVRRQKETRGWDRGFIVSSPVCTAVIAALAIKPRRWTRSAWPPRSSPRCRRCPGPGPPACPRCTSSTTSCRSSRTRRTRSSRRPARSWGRTPARRSSRWAAPIAATCTRVPVRDGHTEAITLGLERAATPDEVAEVIAAYRGRAQELALPSAPAIPLVVRTEIDRPQPHARP